MPTSGKTEMEGDDIVAAINVSSGGIDLDKTVSGTTNKEYTNTEKTKLANIEENATADQTGNEIVAAIQNEGYNVVIPENASCGEDIVSAVEAYGFGFLEHGDRDRLDSIDDIAANAGLPVGTIISFASEDVPDEYLFCDGSELDRTTYSDLFDVIGEAWGAGDGSTTFAIPDLRGRFLRGWDNGGGFDPDADDRDGGDSVGSTQDDAFQGHWHNWNSVATSASSGSDAYWRTGTTTPYADRVRDPVTDGTNGTPRTTSETRPINAAVQYCIKYE